MNDSLFDTLRPFLSRVIASAVAALSGYVTRRYGMALDPDSLNGIASLAMGVAFGVFSIVHKLVDKRINPTDAASKHVAQDGLRVTAELKAMDAT